MTNTRSSDAVYEHLIEMVFSGRWSPGARVVERDLAQQLGVSRIPVREALGRLVAQGILVGGQKQRSVRLREYSPDEMQQLFEFRESMEGGAARVAAKQATAQQKANIERICREMQGHVGTRRYSQQWTTLDFEFHDSIAQASGNEWFASSVHHLLRQCYFVFFQLRWRTLATLNDEQVRQRMARAVQRHRDVLEQIKAGDAEGAEAAMRLHIRESFMHNLTDLRDSEAADSVVPRAARGRRRSPS